MATVLYGTHELDYDSIMEAYDSIKDNPNADGCILISGILPAEVPVKDIYRIVEGINNGTAEINYAPLRLRGYDYNLPSMIESKHELEYEDLCTLEALLSYFKHDTELDMEIANLKEQSLLKEIDRMESQLSKNKKVPEVREDA